MSIINNVHRIGNFTSSKIVALTCVAKDRKSFGKPALTYIKKKNNERRAGKPIETESNAKPLTWGKLVEPQVFDLLGMEYSYQSQETKLHPEIDFWAGSADGLKHDDGTTVFDIKCPLTLDSFCDLVNPLYDGFTGMNAMNIIRENHADGETYYQQLVSNSIIYGTRYAELIVYMPYESELPTIKGLADGQPNCYWVAMACENELPCLIDNGFYQNINVIRFEVPQSDKDLLTEKVIEAGKLLIPRPSVLICSPEEGFIDIKKAV